MRQRQTLGGRFGAVWAVCGSIALSIAVSGGGGAALGQEEPDYHRRALQAFTEARYEQALQLFSLGYAETKQPDLLIRIGQTYLKLGRNAEALQACQAYLAKVENPDPVYKGYADQCIADAQRPAGARPPAPRVSVPPPAPRPSAPPPVPPPSAPPPVAVAPAPAATGDLLGSAPASAPPPAVATAPTAPPAATPPPVVSLPPPVNLGAAYERCLQYQRDGRTDAARSCYLEFLPGALRTGGIPEGDVGALMTQLQRYPEPSSAFPPVLRNSVERRNTGLWAAGLTMWLCAMVPSVAMAFPYADMDPSKKTIYYTMTVPLFGPFIAGIWLPFSYPPGDARNSAAINFTVPWIVADGLAQLVGFTMLLGGAQVRRLPVSPAVERVLSSTRIAPYVTPEGGGGLAAMGRF